MGTHFLSFKEVSSWLESVENWMGLVHLVSSAKGSILEEVL